MESRYLYIFLLSSFFVQIVNARLSLDGRSTNTFDLELYDQALDQELCQRQVEYMTRNDSSIMFNFLDASARIPNGILTGTLVHFGNFFQCLDISKDVPDMKIEGKYCFIDIPFQQDVQLPFDFTTVQNIQSRMKNGFLAVQNKDRSNPDLLGLLKLSLGICIPKACSSNDWVRNALFNVSVLGFEFEEKYCRLPNDKPFVPVDYVAIVVFSILGVLTILGTGYDVYYLHILDRDPKQANALYRGFSVYTNTRRLITFASNSNALECLDGIKSISMMWVIIAHTYSSLIPNMNYLDQYNWLISAKGIWVPTGFFAVDTFFMTAGVLLVYTTMGKMNGVKLLKNLHVFYLNRVLRMLPLMAALILLQASLFHKVADGPYWLNVAKDVERCRHFWWSTLLYVQNYVNPHDICLPHTWYLAIDMQLYFISPIVLFWVLRGGRKSALTALFFSLLAVITAATVYIFINQFPSSFLATADVDLYLKYHANYYVNTLARASPFFIGMVYGYILSILRGQRFQINSVLSLCCWILSLGILALAFYASYLISGREWDNQLGDNFVNSFMRPGWAMALGWIIIACVKGYGGPINWFLSLDIWKFFSRLSYAMYLYHYPLLFIITGTTVTPTYFSAGDKAFEFLGVFTLSFIVSFVVTVVIDAPFSTLIKMVLQGGTSGHQKPKPTPTVQNNDLGISGSYKKEPAV